MATKIKAPPKLSGGDVHALLKNPSSKGYSTKMAKLLGFLQATVSIRTGAEIVERDITIAQDGGIVKQIREEYIESVVDNYRWNDKEIKAIKKKSESISEDIFSQEKLLRRRKKAEAIAKVEEEINRLCNEKTALNVQAAAMIIVKRNELCAADISLKEMREYLMFYEGVKIRLDLQTGSYTFPVPVDTPFYREVCNVMGLPLEGMVAEKPVVKRMFQLPTGALQSLKKAIRFASMDDLRPAMTCVLVEIRNGKMQVIATDAHRLYLSQVFEVSGPKGNYDYLLPAKTVARLPKATTEDFIMYELKGGKAVMLGLEMPLLDAKFPDYRVVVPKYEHGVTFDRVTMIGRVKETIPYTNKATCQVNLHINGQIEFSGQDVDFSFETTNRMAFKSNTMEELLIGFNGKFLVDALSVFNCDDITLQAVAPHKAGIITDGNETVLVMPLMTNQ